MFELFSDIYFVVYKLYYVGQNDNLDIRVSLKNWDRGSIGFELVEALFNYIIWFPVLPLIKKEGKQPMAIENQVKLSAIILANQVHSETTDSHNCR
jgi:hypothetical protein